jgi:MHS family proline/betaine transporter-like MFS transporter
MVSIVLMTVGALALTPAYETIGIFAPIAVLTARLVQGFSAGGGSSTAFLVEHAPDRRGFIASRQFASQGLSGLLASAFGIGLTAWMAPAEMQALAVADSVPVRGSGRAGRHLHPQPS